MVKAVIFDVDGVLIDNTKLIIKIYQEAALACGKKRPSRKKVISVLGRTGPDMVRRLIGKNPAYRRIQRQIWHLYEPKMRLASGLKPALEKIRIKTAIVTSRRPGSLRRSLGKYIKYFSVVITPINSAEHKPSPKPLRLACHKLKISPAEAVYVGDAITDYQAARRAKITFIAMISGGLTKSQIQKLGIKRSIKSLGELPKLIEKL